MRRWKRRQMRRARRARRASRAVERGQDWGLSNSASIAWSFTMIDFTKGLADGCMVKIHASSFKIIT